MADAAVATPGTSADYNVRIVRSEGTVDIPNNRSYLYVDLYLVTIAANGAGGAFNLNPGSTGYVNGDLGTIINWSGTYDMRPAASLPSLLLGHYEGWVTHNADGSKTVNFGYGFSGQGGSPLGSGSGSDSIVLTKIPRAPSPKVGGVYKQGEQLSIKVGGVYKDGEMFVKVGGVYKPMG